MKTLSIDKYKVLMLGTAPLPESYRQIKDLFWPPPSTPPTESKGPTWPSGRVVRAFFYYFLYIVVDAIPRVIILLLIWSVLAYWFGFSQPFSQPEPATVQEYLEHGPTTSVWSPNHNLLRIFQVLAIILAAFFSDRYFRWWRVGRKKILARDPRPPVLILRRFTQQQLAQIDDVNTFGEQFEALLKGYGPLVSLRNDLQKLPPLGPYSLQVENSEWQKEVLSFIEHAAAIIVFAGLSQGLLWELNEIAARGLLYRTAFIIPAGFKVYDFKLLKKLITETSESKDDTPYLTELKKLLPLIKPLAIMPEFQVLWQDEVNEALVIRWTLEGEPVVITGRKRTPEAVNEALSLSILISGERSASKGSMKLQDSHQH